MAFREGDRFGRYIIGPLLGQGGMGEVRRAEDTILVRAVALKILLHDEAWGEGVSPSAEAIARLMREARAAAALDHPNAVAIFDVGEEGDHPYIAMELIDGVTLRALIGDEEQPLDRRIRWSLEVARALAAAHRRGIVHRDVKPENVMVREDGVVKVLDFGIARSAPLVDASGAKSTRAPGSPILPTLTEKGLSVGTPLYMAPEQLRGEPVDPRCDQFAWGVVVYELLTGASPWASDGGPLQAVSNILTRKPPSMRAANPAIPAEVDELVRRALSKDASDRFATMDDVVRALEPHAGVAPERRAATLPPQRVKRRRTLVLTLALVAATLGAAGGAFRMRETRRARERPEPEAKLESADASVRAGKTSRGSALSVNAQANIEYRAGIQALRDASTRAAIARFQKAVELDPSFAAANLGLLCTAWAVDDELREVFRAAEASRGSLGEADRALLNAFAPWMLPAPDIKLVESRLSAITARDPTDVDALVALAKVRIIALDFNGSLAPLEAAQRLEPGRADIFDLRGTVYASLDRVDDAMHEYGLCTDLAPGATSCLRTVIQLQLDAGKCAEAETTARRMIKIEPNGSTAYAFLAYSLFREGQPLESVRLALQGQIERSQEKSLTMADVRVTMAVLEGNFDEALKALADWQGVLRDAPEDARHFDVLEQSADLLFEIGRTKEVAALAQDYVKRRGGWTPDPSSVDPTLLADALRYRAGDLSRAAFLRARESWRAREWIRLGLATEREGRSALWFDGYARGVKTVADAKEAVAVMDAFAPFPRATQRNLRMDEALGGTLLRAGRVEEALPLLRRASGSCLAAAYPFDHAHAIADLGDALQKLGDRPGACYAYGELLARWGKARPPSVTAERVRASARTLHCTTQSAPR